MAIHSSPYLIPDDSKMRAKPRLSSILYEGAQLVLDQWFLLGMAVVIAVASQFQVPSSHVQLKELVVTYLCVSVIFFITGCTLPTKVLIDNYSRWQLHLFVQVQCFLMTSAVMFGIVSACATNKEFMDAGLLIGLIFTGSVPTTISSNVVMTRKAHGNDALTVVQTTIGNFLGPFITPLLVQMYISTGAWYTGFLPETSSGDYSEIYRRVFKQIGLSVFLPVVRYRPTRFFALCTGCQDLTIADGRACDRSLGKSSSTSSRKQRRRSSLSGKLNKLGSFSLLAIIWQTFDEAFGSGAFSSVKSSNMIFTVFISIAYFLIWLTVCLVLSIPWLPKKDTIAAAYCVPAKAPVMGVVLSNLMFTGLSPIQQAKIQIPMVIFQGLQISISSILTVFFRKWVASEEGKADKEKGDEQSDSGNRSTDGCDSGV